jgi:hypothetical protein
MFVFAGCTAKETAMSDLAIFHYGNDHRNFEALLKICSIT